MIHNKYANDYKLENVLDAKGRTVTKAIYKGVWYGFVKSPEEVKKASRRLAAAAGCAALSLAAGLSFYANTGFSAQYYTNIPFLVCAFPLIFLFVAVYSLFRPREKYTREQKDKTGDRIAKTSFLGMLFSGVNLVGIIVAAILKLTGVETRPVRLNDIIFIVFSVLLFASTIFAFSLRKEFVMEEMNN